MRKNTRRTADADKTLVTLYVVVSDQVSITINYFAVWNTQNFCLVNCYRYSLFKDK